MVFCNIIIASKQDNINAVTILILIDGFLQFKLHEFLVPNIKSHNPYFNRWFSAILSFYGLLT